MKNKKILGALLQLGKFALLLLGLVLGGYLLLVAAYMLPTAPMSANVADSRTVFEVEGTYHDVIPGEGSAKQDNFTDAIMLLNAEYPGTESPWKKALNVPKISAEGLDSPHVLLAYHAGEALEYKTSSYARYWHGYLAILKPVLLLFNYKQIRCLLIFLQAALIYALMYLFGKKGKQECFLPLLGAVVLLNPATCAMSLQYSSIFFLTFAQLLVFLLCETAYQSNFKLWLYHFIIVGALASYLDLLTYPLVSFGVPIAYLLSQHIRGAKNGLAALVKCGIAWGFGYAGMWASKWALATLITGEDVMANALGAAQFRVSKEYNGTDYSPLRVIYYNVRIGKRFIAVVLALFALCVVYALLKKRFRLTSEMLPQVCVWLLPLLWYTVLSNHSGIHCWFTYRELAICAYAGLTIGTMLVYGQSDRQTLSPRLFPEQDSLSSH